MRNLALAALAVCCLAGIGWQLWNHGHAVGLADGYANGKERGRELQRLEYAENPPPIKVIEIKVPVPEPKIVEVPYAIPGPIQQVDKIVDKYRVIQIIRKEGKYGSEDTDSGQIEVRDDPGGGPANP